MLPDDHTTAGLRAGWGYPRESITITMERCRTISNESCRSVCRQCGRQQQAVAQLKAICRPVMKVFLAFEPGQQKRVCQRLSVRVSKLLIVSIREEMLPPFR